MKTRPIDNVKLGLFVIAGSLFLIFSLYMIGRNRNFFGSTFMIQASFHNVNGLTPGNSVRFSGIDVGTVRNIEIENDTSILVTMVIDKKARSYIKKNSIAAIGTDGLMGNRLININSNPAPSPPVDEGDLIGSLMPIETDEMLRTLNTTNDNFEVISSDLKKIIQKVNNSNSLWKLLSDTTVAKDLKQVVTNAKLATGKASVAGDEIVSLARTLRSGEGLIGTLLSDTSLSLELRESLNNIRSASGQTKSATQDINEILSNIQRGEGAVGAILADTVLVDKLTRSLENIEQGTYRFNENMEAMKHNFLFRSYFRKVEKKDRKLLLKNQN